MVLGSFADSRRCIDPIGTAQLRNSSAMLRTLVPLKGDTRNSDVRSALKLSPDTTSTCRSLSWGGEGFIYSKIILAAGPSRLEPTARVAFCLDTATALDSRRARQLPGGVLSRSEIRARQAAFLARLSYMRQA
jgi:hypothetical protein